MNLRHLSLFAVLALGAGACTGGSSADRATAADCNSQSKFCLHACNLGCTVAGTCAVSEIAQNQPIELHFTDTIDPASVTAGAISLKTASGESPAGEFLVSGASLVFVPQVRITGGITRFGFRAGETYILNLRSGEQGDTLRSASGDRLARNVVCSLSVTQGLVDLDGQAPQAELIAPAVTVDVATDSQIVVRFSELIDLSQFQGGSTQVSPILYQIRKSIEDPNDPSQRVCDPNFTPVLIGGVPVATVRATNPPTTEIALQPAIELPNEVCVEVTITEQVRDLSGRAAERRVFRFFTEAGTPEPVTLTETFATDQRMDRLASGGTWAGGRAVPATIGGGGRLGSFDPAVGQSIGAGTFLFNTDSQLFPASSTLFGVPIEVTDGVFEFTDFIVPSGTRVVFRGSKPAIIKVRGACRVEGELSVDGVGPSSTFDGDALSAGPIGQVGPPVQGEPSRPGGAGAGAGGRGGQSCLGAGVTAAMRGAPGENCVPVATSGYIGNVGGSGGRGGDVFPATGNRVNVFFSVFLTFSGMVSGGAGGGSFLGAGTAGRVLRTFTAGQPGDAGPGAAAGSTVAFQALPGGLGALEHFLVGGSGGGGGGSHTVNMTTSEVNGSPGAGRKAWHAGGAGGGGGGALAVIVGHTFSVEGSGVVASRGGGGAEHRSEATGPPAPGGGGSGGSIVIQAEEATKVAQNGTIDVSGGLGTYITNPQLTGTRMEARGGDGGHGFVRVEADGATAATLGIVNGPASIPSGSFADLPTAAEDTRSGFVSLWRSSRQLFPPTFVHYRLVARVNGQEVVYSDDPANFNPANRNDLPVRVYIQGGTVNPATNELDGTPGPWRDFVNGDGGRQSINSDNANGFRFMMIFNRDIETDVVVEEFQVTFEA